MNTAHQYYSPPHTEPSTVPFNLANYVSNIISDPTLSKNASATMVQLTLSAGRKGYCELLIYSIAVKIKSSRTQTKLYLKELQDKKRIKIIYRTGRSSIYQILDILPENVGPSRFSDYIQDIKKRKNQRSERTNVILNFPDKENHPIVHSKVKNTKQVVEEPSPTLAEENTDPALKTVNQQTLSIRKSSTATNTVTKVIATSTVLNTATNTAFDMSLVREILEVTGDRKSTACFIRIVRDVPKDIIFAALSSLKVAMREDYVLRPGAYFVQVVKQYCPDVFQEKKQPLRPPQNKIDGPIYTKLADIEPEVQRNHDLNMSQILNIRRLLDKKIY